MLNCHLLTSFFRRQYDLAKDKKVGKLYLFKNWFLSSRPTCLTSFSPFRSDVVPKQFQHYYLLQSLPRTRNQNFKTHFLGHEIFSLNFSIHLLSPKCRQWGPNVGLRKRVGLDLVFRLRGKASACEQPSSWQSGPIVTILCRGERELKVVRSRLEGSPSNLHTHTLTYLTCKCNCFDSSVEPCRPLLLLPPLFLVSQKTMGASRASSFSKRRKCMLGTQNLLLALSVSLPFRWVRVCVHWSFSDMLCIANCPLLQIKLFWSFLRRSSRYRRSEKSEICKTYSSSNSLYTQKAAANGNSSSCMMRSKQLKQLLKKNHFISSQLFSTYRIDKNISGHSRKRSSLVTESEILY